MQSLGIKLPEPKNTAAKLDEQILDQDLRKISQHVEQSHLHHSESLTGGTCKKGVHRLQLEPFFPYDICTSVSDMKPAAPHLKSNRVLEHFRASRTKPHSKRCAFTILLPMPR
jgi:hypothetical protein